MNSRNGISKQFRFKVEDPVTRTPTYFDFSFKYQSMKYWTKETWVVHTDLGGTDHDKFRYLHHYFEINWSELITGEDADKLSAIRNAEFRGARLFITPHIDVLSREFEVKSVKESGEQIIEFSQIVNNSMSPGNKGTIIVYKTVRPHYRWDIVDPSTQQGIISSIFQLIQG
jgi:hypothetical protein